MVASGICNVCRNVDAAGLDEHEQCLCHGKGKVVTTIVSTP